MLHLILIKKVIGTKTLNGIFQNLFEQTKQSLIRPILVLRGMYYLAWKYNHLIFRSLELDQNTFLNSFEYLYFRGPYFHDLLATNINIIQCLHFRA